MKKLPVLLITAVLIPATFTLTGCGHKNPLVTADNQTLQESIGFARDRILLRDDSDPIKDCVLYYAGKGKSTDKDKCEHWSAATYKIWMAKGELPAATTLDDFRDSRFWQAVIS